MTVGHALVSAPLKEYEAARDVGWVRRDDRALVRVYGRDPVRMIQGIITNDIAGAPAHRAVYAAILTPKGRMIADMRVFRIGEELRIETDAGALEGVTATLRKYVPPLFARAEILADHAVLGVYGMRAREALAALLGDSLPGPREHDLAHVDGDAVTVVLTTRYTGDEGFDVIGPSSAIEMLENDLQNAGVASIGEATLEVLRIEAGSPRWGRELSDGTIPIEAGLESSAISTTKGCYTGQEVIVRIMHRGHVNRHLRGLLLGSAEVAVGDELVHPETGKVIGNVTSACRSPRFGQTIALGYVRREVEPGATVSLAGSDAQTPVRVIALPFE